MKLLRMSQQNLLHGILLRHRYSLQRSFEIDPDHFRHALHCVHFDGWRIEEESVSACTTYEGKLSVEMHG